MFILLRLNSNKGTKSDIEIAPAKRFEAVVQIGSGGVVVTGDKLLAGAISQQALTDDRGASASSRQRLGDSWQHISGDNPAGFSGNQAPKIGCLNGADNWGMPRRHNPLVNKGLGKPPCRFWYLCWNLT